MAKAGKEYEALVAAVVRAFDKGATVTAPDKVRGPDGIRDVDVSVRGTVDGVPRFTLIEAKDWNYKRPVGIERIDALESKMRDLEADAAVLYSNSGFTGPAL